MVEPGPVLAPLEVPLEIPEPRQVQTAMQIQISRERLHQLRRKVRIRPGAGQAVAAEQQLLALIITIQI